MNWYYVLQLHLFDIEIPGDISFKESDTFAAGDKPTIVDTGMDLGQFNIAMVFNLITYEYATVKTICW